MLRFMLLRGLPAHGGFRERRGLVTRWAAPGGLAGLQAIRI